MRDLPRFEHPDLIAGTEGFSDAGVYRLRDDLLIVQSLDFFPPLVDDPFTFGQIAAANSLSDLYAMGATPVTALNIVGFPDDKLEMSVLADILRGGADRVRLAGAVVAGGHTVRDVEIKFGLSATGTVHPDQLITNRGARPGDHLVLTKPLGTGFVTTAAKGGRCSDDVLQAAIDSMIGLNQAASIAAVGAGAHAVTDITGFGLAGHAGEMAAASGTQLVIEAGRLPLLPGAEPLLRRGFRTRASDSNREFALPHLHIQPGVDSDRLEFVFDPQTSGGLLISVPADRLDELLEKALEGGALVAAPIGRVEVAGQARVVIEP